VTLEFPSFDKAVELAKEKIVDWLREHRDPEDDTVKTPRYSAQLRFVDMTTVVRRYDSGSYPDDHIYNFDVEETE
jgi:hypothetical protein